MSSPGASESSDPKIFQLAAAVGAGIASVVAGGLTYKWMSDTTAAGPTPSLGRDGVVGTVQSKQLSDGAYTSTTLKESELMSFFYEDAKTLFEVFQRGIRVSNNGPCLGHRVNDGPYEWVSYQDVYDQAHKLGCGLVGKLGAKRGEFVSIYSQNRVEWTVTEQACNQFSLVLVPLYDTLGTESCAYILGQTNSSIVICDTVKKVESLLECKKEAKGFRYVVLMLESLPEDLVAKTSKAGIELLSYVDLLKFGSEHDLPIDPPKPDDLATLCYTSGTTGFPKGAQLTHRNIVSDIGGVYAVMKMSTEIPELSPNDTHISYLPLAHMFERAVHTVSFMHGMRIGFFRGNVLQLMDDMQVLKPTLFCTVPRLLNRLYDRVQAGVAGSFIKRKLLEIAINKKTALLNEGIITNSSFWDKIVFSKVHALTGGRIRMVITGSAPISSKVLCFTRAAFGCPVFEGYGQTEATAAITVTLPGENELGHVGPPIPCNKVKLIDVPEMGYLSANRQGEVAVKGNNVFTGYYKQPDKTKEAFDADGWLLTGDIGEWTENGCLRIVDRRKHLFKLAQGEYVAPEKIEQVLTRSPFIAQIYVDGSSLESCVLGVVVPDPETAIPWAKSHGLASNMEEICTNANFKRVIMEDITKISRENGLKGFEIPRDIHLEPELFSVENGLLTPTFKSKRPDLQKRYKSAFDAAYEVMREKELAAANSGNSLKG